MNQDARLQIAFNIPPETRRQMERIKSERRISFTEQVVEAIDRLYADLFPAADDLAVVLGYVRLDRPGDVAPDEMTCAECGRTIEFDRTGAFLAALKAGEDITLTGPLCALCASSA